MSRLKRYLQEANAHLSMIDEALEELEGSDLTKLRTRNERFAAEILILSFAKLQDLLGAKLFRTFLEEQGFVVAQKSFFDLLRELEKEGIVDIDRWSELRKLRNSLSHEYPLQESERYKKLQWS